MASPTQETPSDEDATQNPPLNEAPSVDIYPGMFDDALDTAKPDLRNSRNGTVSWGGPYDQYPAIVQFRELSASAGTFENPERTIVAGRTETESQEVNPRIDVKLRPFTVEQDHCPHIELSFTFVWSAENGSKRSTCVCLRLNSVNCTLGSSRFANCFSKDDVTRNDAWKDRGNVSYVLDIEYKPPPERVYSSNLVEHNDCGVHNDFAHQVARYKVLGAHITIAIQFNHRLDDTIRQIFKSEAYDSQAAQKDTHLFIPRPNFIHLTALSENSEISHSQEHEYEELCAARNYKDVEVKLIKASPAADSDIGYMFVQDQSWLKVSSNDTIDIDVHRSLHRCPGDCDWVGRLDDSEEALAVVPRGYRLFNIERQETIKRQGKDEDPSGDEYQPIMTRRRSPALGRPGEYLLYLPSNASAEQILTSLRGASRREVHINIVPDHKQKNREGANIKGLTTWSLTKPGGSAANGYRLDLILANRFDRLPVSNFFAGIPAHYLREICTSLGTDQQRFVRSLERMHGGMALLVGPAGTGKSQMLVEILMTMVRYLQSQAAQSRSGLKTLFVTPTNPAGDTLSGYLFNKRQSSPAFADVLIIRNYTASTDRSILIKNARRVSYSSGRGESIDVAKIGRDLRVKPLGRSLAIGAIARRVVQDDPSDGPLSPAELRAQNAIPKSDREALRDLLTLRDISESSALLKKAYRPVKEAILGAADFVISTAPIASDKSICDVFEPERIVMDEAAMTGRLDGFCFTRYKNNPSIIMTGDFMQTAPRVRAPASRNKAHAQLQISFFACLVAAGFWCTYLREQYRYTEQVCAMVSWLFYSRRLTCANATDLAMMAATKCLVQFTKAYVNTSSSIILLDVKKSTEIVESSSHSKKNKMTSIAVWNLVSHLLAHGYAASDIAIISPYKGQCDVHRAWAQNLAKADPSVWRTTTDATTATNSLPAAFDERDILITTAEGAQSQSRDIVILDVPNTERIGFLDDKKRWCTMVTRARHGVFFVLDRSQVCAALQKEKKAGPLERIIYKTANNRSACQAPMPADNHPILKKSPL